MNKPLLIKDSIDYVKSFAQPGKPVVYVPTTSGGLKIAFDNHHFAHHFTRNAIAHWRCVNFTKGKCDAKILIKEKICYPVFGITHNHTNNAIADDASGGHSPQMKFLISLKNEKQK